MSINQHIFQIRAQDDSGAVNTIIFLLNDVAFFDYFQIKSSDMYWSKYVWFAVSIKINYFQTSTTHL